MNSLINKHQLSYTSYQELFIHNKKAFNMCLIELFYRLYHPLKIYISFYSVYMIFCILRYSVYMKNCVFAQDLLRTLLATCVNVYYISCMFMLLQAMYTIAESQEFL